MDSNKAVVDHFIAKHPFSAAKTLEALSNEEVAEFVQELSIYKRTKLLGLMNFAKASQCFLALPLKKKVEIIEHGEAAWVESLMRLMDEKVRENLLKEVSDRKSAEIRSRLALAPNSVGIFMFPAVTLSRSMTVKTALEVIKSNKDYFDSAIFVVNLEGVLQGVVQLKAVVLAEPSESIEQLMVTNPPKFLSDTPIINVLNHPGWMDYDSIPVIDSAERLLGALSYTNIKELNFTTSKPQSQEIIKTGTALGELYLIGISGMLSLVRKENQ